MITSGVHFPNGPHDSRLFDLPGPILMLSTEARYTKNSDPAKANNRLFVERAVPRIGHRPAELNYDIQKCVDEVTLLYNESNHRVGEHFQPYNELNLNYERGDNEDDHEQLLERMVRLKNFLSKLEPALRPRLANGTYLHFPPWVPDSRAYNYIDLWKPVAEQYDVISIHIYGPPKDTIDWVQTHLDLFPNKKIFLSEWWNDEPAETIRRLNALSAANPNFIGSTWFIGKWYNAPSNWPTKNNVQDNPLLYNIFLNQETVVPTNPPVAELKAYAKQKCLDANYDWPTYERQIQQESRWKHYDSTGNILTSPGGAKGIGQIVPSSHPTANWQDPYSNLDYSLNLMFAHKKKFGTYRLALAAYNWGPGNVAGYTDSVGNVHPKWPGTREWMCPVNGPYCKTAQRNQYLDKILGVGWPEPITSEPEPVPMPPTYSVGQGILDKMAAHGDTPATHEMYFKHNGEDQYSSAYGHSGAYYVYLPTTGIVSRFPPDR